MHSATLHAAQDLPLEVVHEDNHLIVLNKAAGVVVHPGPGNYSGTLVNALLHRFGMSAVRLEPDQAPEDPELSDSGTAPLCCSAVRCCAVLCSRALKNGVLSSGLGKRNARVISAVKAGWSSPHLLLDCQLT